MKIIKSFKLFEVVQIPKMNDVDILYDDNDQDYKIIFLMKGEDIVGFVNEGMQTTTMEERDIHCIGSIWGPGYGDLLYALAISKFGPIVPSANVSDKAKESHKRRLDNDLFLKYKIKGIGVYYREEDYLNTIFDLDPETKQFLRAKIQHNDDKELSKRMLKMFLDKKNEMYRNFRDYYTIGKSKYKRF